MDKSTVYWVIILLTLVLFSGFLTEITGKAELTMITKPTAGTTVGGCYDSDSGVNTKVLGYALDKRGTRVKDICKDTTTVKEAVCKPQKTMFILVYLATAQDTACPTGTSCLNGVCCDVTTWTPATSTVCSGQSFTQTSDCKTTRQATGTKYCPPPCEDSETGKDYYTQGTVAVGSYSVPDCCTAAAGGPCVATGPVLNETYCGIPKYSIYEIPMSERYTCPRGCENGACIPTALQLQQ